MTCDVCGHEQDRGRFCGRCGAKVAPPVDEAGAPSGTAAATRRLRLPGWSPAILLLALVVVSWGVARLVTPSAGDEVGVGTPQGPTDRSALRPASPTADPDPETTPAGPVFRDGTGTVLLFDDGTTGALALDLDTGTTERIELPGQRAGDQPYRLWRLGDRVVVGWGEILAVAPGTDAEPRTLGQATVFLPAADPEQLWLVDHAGPVDGSASTWTLIDAEGRVVASTDSVPGYEPLRGIPGGLALRDEAGRVWRYDLEEDVVVEASAEGTPGWIGDVTREHVAWCTEDPCRSITISSAAATQAASVGDGARFSEDHVWLSPDGAWLAAVVAIDVGGGTDRRLRIYDVASGGVLADAQLPLGTAYGTWDVGGKQFFSWVHFVGGGSGAPALLSRWSRGDAIEQVDVRGLGVEGVYRVVALPRVGGPGVVVTARGACPESERSDAMGSLPAWRGEQIHVALPRSAPADVPEQLWVGIPGADSGTTVTLSAQLVDDDVRAGFRLDDRSDWQTEFRLRSGMRTASGFPPHWAVASRFPAPGCWAVTVSTGELTETVTVELRFDE
ncbi:MAG: hypothetical protein KY461_12265 [Actinobacteria bacterium]|nr:hypothetical protein [Actinomycetota bacterium]